MHDKFATIPYAPHIALRVFLTTLVAAALIVCCTSISHACDVPVNRYALERWQSTVYELTILHDGPLSEAQQQWISKIEKESMAEDAKLNVYVQTIDLAEAKAIVETENNEAAEEEPADEEADAAADNASLDDNTPNLIEKPELSFAERRRQATLKRYYELWQTLGEPQLPHMLLIYPMIPPPESIFWQGSLTEANIDALMQSPVRENLVGQLLDGVSCVWVLLACGDEKLDSEAEKTLTESIDQFKVEYIKVMFPQPDDQNTPEDSESGSDAAMAVEASYDDVSEIPKLVYPIIRLNQDDPQEALLIQLLLHTEPDLKDYLDQPIAIPVFGRARALYGLVGKGISAENIFDTCAFMIGPCSCTVKDANPGIDLVVACPWDEELARIEYEAYQELEAAGTEAVDAGDEEQDSPQPLVSLSTLAEAAGAEGTADEGLTADEPSSGDSTHSDAGHGESEGAADSHAEEASHSSFTPSHMLRTIALQTLGAVVFLVIIACIIVVMSKRRS